MDESKKIKPRHQKTAGLLPCKPNVTILMPSTDFSAEIRHNLLCKTERLETT
jgi:hypothetical protein